MMAHVRVRWSVALAVLLAVSAGADPAGGAPPIKGLSESASLARAYALVYDADFAAADVELQKTCGPAPLEACHLIGAANQWWRHYLDIDNHAPDQALQTRFAGVIDETEKWTVREPQRAEAWFYLGAAYGLRVQYHANHAEYLAGARDGKRVKESLEKCLALDPGLQDANFGIGMYEYYADIVPSVLKWFRWMFALPGGNKDKGMRQMLQTRGLGLLMKDEAAYQLHFVEIWYEKQPELALDLLAELRGRRPHNPMFLLNTAQVHENYRGDHTSALREYQLLVEGARTGSLHEADLAAAWGHLGAAEQFEALAEADRAMDEARQVIDARALRPFGAMARAQLLLGRAADRIGLRDQAVAAYRVAQSTAPAADPGGVRKAANEGLSHAPDRSAAEANRLSLEGWRAFERGASDEAIAKLDRAVQLQANDGIHRSRRGRVLLARGDRARALADFERVTQARPMPPAPMLANAFLECARMYEGSGDRARAVSSYEWATKVRGIDAATQTEAQQALARLKR